jgi:DNA-binding HxlR family transcriptional regulator
VFRKAEHVRSRHDAIGAPPGPRALLARCEGLSSSVMYERLRELSEAGLVSQGPSGYELTAVGAELGAALAPLDAWAKSWARQLAP